MTNPFLTIANLLPALVAGTVAIETTIKSEAPGTAKKQVLIDALQSAAKVGETMSNTEVVLASTLIDSLVSSFNTVGFFKKATPAPAAEVPAPAAA